MTLTTHAMLGAIIGAQLPTHPELAFLLGFLSHFAVDTIPHGDRAMYEGHKSKTAQKRAIAYVTTDAIVALMLVAFLVASASHTITRSMAAGIIGSVLPDLVSGIYEAWAPRRLRWFNRLHLFFHNIITNKTGDIPLLWGLAGQAVFIGLMMRFV